MRVEELPIYYPVKFKGKFSKVAFQEDILEGRACKHIDFYYAYSDRELMKQLIKQITFTYERDRVQGEKMCSIMFRGHRPTDYMRRMLDHAWAIDHESKVALVFYDIDIPELDYYSEDCPIKELEGWF